MHLISPITGSDFGALSIEEVISLLIFPSMASLVAKGLGSDGWVRFVCDAEGMLLQLTYPTVGELPKSSVMVDVIKSLYAFIEPTLPITEYVVSNAPMNDAPEDIVYEFVAS